MAGNKMEDAAQSFIQKTYFGGETPEEVTEQKEEVTPITPKEETKEETPIVPPTETTPKEVTEEKQEEDDKSYFTEFFPVEDKEVTEPKKEDTPLEPIKTKDKVKYNLKDYVDSNSEALDKYFRLRNLDVDNMSSEDLIKYKLSKQHPTWSNEDIKEELKDSYGIGLKLKTVPSDALPSEVEEIEKYNERINDKIRRGERLLKSDIAETKAQLKSDKEQALLLPEVELDVEVNSDPTTIITAYQEQAVKQQKQFVEEVWAPNIKTAVSKAGGFKQTLDFDIQEGEKMSTEIVYRFSDAQKAQLEQYLVDYQYHPSDAKYIKNQETGEVDFDRLVNDKAQQLFAPDIIKVATKTAMSKLKEKFLKEEVVNFTDTPRRTATQTQPRSKEFDVWENSAQYHQRR